MAAGDAGASAAVLQNGKVVAAGFAVTGATPDFALTRYRPDGTLDTSFGNHGRVTTDFAGGFDDARALGVLGGKLVAAGSAATGSGPDFALARYDDHGSLDPTFGTGGKVTTDFAPVFGDADEINALIIQQGKLVGVASGSLAGHPVALASSGEALGLPVVDIAYPLPAGLSRWADPRVTGNMGVTQGVHVRPILVDACAYLISSADGPVAGDEDIDVVRRALEQPQRGEVVLDRVRGVVQVEHRNQDIRKHVAGDQNPAFLDQQCRMARGMRLMLDNPDLRAIPRNVRSFGRQTGNEAEQVQRYLLGDFRR